MLASLIESVFVYAYPLYATALTRYRATEDESNLHRHAPNTLLHERSLSDHATRWITSPNNDTLYSNAWLDLSAGPVRIAIDTMPDGRYWSVALMDAWTNHFAILGQRLDGAGPTEVTVVGLGMPIPADAKRVIQAPGLDAWLFARNLVDGPQDLPLAHAMQDRMSVHVVADSARASHRTERVRPQPLSQPAAFLDVVNEALLRNPPPDAEAHLLEQWRQAGLRPGVVDAWSGIGESARNVWTGVLSGAGGLLRQFGTRGRRDVQGWLASAPEMGQFGAHHTLRASVALGGLGALEQSEAMYFVRMQDDDGDALDGHHRYVLKVPPQGIPTDSFWSFTMYEPTADGQRFFVANSIGRYSIGNRTQALHVQPDGALHLVLQRDEPIDPHDRANWLPAPTGAFQIALRAYLPRAALRQGVAPMPTIVRL